MKNDLNNRLNKILMQDKSVVPSKILPALKSDLRDLLREYGELKSDINVDIDDMEDGYSLVVFATFNRFKQ